MLFAVMYQDDMLPDLYRPSSVNYWNLVAVKKIQIVFFDVYYVIVSTREQSIILENKMYFLLYRLWFLYYLLWLQKLYN